MSVQVAEQADKYVKAHKKRRNWKKLVLGLVCIVVFCTTYALVLPAITMEETPKCGKEEHTHSEKCYVQVTPETAGSGASSSSHVHTDDCFHQERGALICTEEETEGHIHSREAGCYTESSVLVCGVPEGVAHTHSEACYETVEELTCSLEESTGHKHTESCYEWSQVLDCGLSAEPEKSNGTDVQDSTAIEDSKKLTCTLPEDENHTHGPLCYGTWELVCQLEEHTQHCLFFGSGGGCRNCRRLGENFCKCRAYRSMG